VTPDESTATAISAARVSMARYSDTVVFHIQGELDATTVPVLRAGLADAAEDATVLLDLTGVGVVDSVGLGALLGAIRHIHEHGGRVAAVGGPAATMALRAAGADRIVFVADSPEAGLGWLHQSGSHWSSGAARVNDRLT
jgi:anti-sigma B factor antagonist